jgi:hypothetical protein
MSSGFTVGWEVQSFSLDKTATTFFHFFSFLCLLFHLQIHIWEMDVRERECVCMCKYGSQPFVCIQLGGVNTIPTSQGIRTPSSHIQRVSGRSWWEMKANANWSDQKKKNDFFSLFCWDDGSAATFFCP